jgi:hypothetical protein
MVHGEKWEQWEDDFLRAKVKVGWSYYRIAKRLGRTWAACRLRARLIGIYTMVDRKRDEEYMLKVAREIAWD